MITSCSGSLRRLLGAVALASAVTIAVGACSGSSRAAPKVAGAGAGQGASASATTAAPAGNAAALWSAAAACMRQHGLNVYDPTIDGQGQPQFDPTSQSIIRATAPAAFAAVRQSCQAQLSAAAAATPSKNQTVDLAGRTKFAQCMRAHGVSNWPDPSPQGGDFSLHQTGIDPNAPAVTTAVSACRSALSPADQAAIGR